MKQADITYNNGVKQALLKFTHPPQYLPLDRHDDPASEPCDPHFCSRSLDEDCEQIFIYVYIWKHTPISCHQMSFWLTNYFIRKIFLYNYSVSDVYGES